MAMKKTEHCIARAMTSTTTEAGPRCPFVRKSLKSAGTTHVALMSRSARTTSKRGNTLKTNRHRPNVCAVSTTSIYNVNGIMPQLDFLVCYRRMSGTVILDMCYLKKIISSDITAFEPGTLASLLVEHVGNVTVDF